MPNIVDSLKDLYVVFGGEAADVDTLTNITYAANAISALLGGDSNAMNITDALENISAVVPTGGGEEYEEMLNGLIAGSATKITTSAENIRPYAFYNNSTIQIVELTAVTNINSCAFGHCDALKKVIIRSTAVPSIYYTTVSGQHRTDVFSGEGFDYAETYIYVPDELIDEYKTTPGWDGRMDNGVDLAATILPISMLHE